jgi:hypothetical protein
MRHARCALCALNAVHVQKGRPYPQLTSREAMTRRIGKGLRHLRRTRTHTDTPSTHIVTLTSQMQDHTGARRTQTRRPPRTQTRTDTHARTHKHTRTHKHARTHTQTRTHARTGTHRHITLPRTHARTHARTGALFWSAGQAPTIPVECSTSCRDFLVRCFEPDAAKRPVAKALLSHAWLDVCQS